MKLIIQIPCYNEGETLRIALDALPRSIEGIDKIEYLIIDDGSVDNTVSEARDWGVNYIVHFCKNKGLAKGFMAGIDACLRNGADIIVNTDADNQYNADDIEKLVRPILEGKADMVVGARPIDETADFSALKKKLQHVGSWTVRVASGTEIPDAPSGFRAFSREAALRLNVINQYTYTLETIIQAGYNKIPLESVPVRTNPELRKSRLFHSMFGYIKKSSVTILRSYLMYRPLKFFGILGTIFNIAGLAFAVRYIIYKSMGEGSGHVQSVIIMGVLFMIGIISYLLGLQADVIAANRKLIEDVQYHARRSEYDISEIKEKINTIEEKIEEEKS